MTNSPCQPYVQCKYTSTCALAPDHLNINYTLLQRITVEFVGRVASTSLEFSREILLGANARRESN